MAQGLYALDVGLDKWNDVDALAYQAAQVSIISVFNCVGRIFIGKYDSVFFKKYHAHRPYVNLGVISDITKSRLHFPRSYCLVLVSALVLTSQIVAAFIVHISNLWKASALLGLGYGTIYGLFPTMAIEWFGMRQSSPPLFLAHHNLISLFLSIAHFSENWGYISLSPLVGGYIFSIAFGRNLDAHEARVQVVTLEPQPATSEDHIQSTLRTLAKRLEPGGQCLVGRECYVQSLYLTIGGCCVALLLSAWAGWRDRRRKRDGRVVVPAMQRRVSDSDAD
jgi:hypothetical protein